MSALPLPVEPDYEEQAFLYRSVDAEHRERQYLAAQFLLAEGASWIEIETAIEFFYPQSADQSYLNTWAKESLDRLSKNARQRSGPATAAERK